MSNTFRRMWDELLLPGQKVEEDGSVKPATKSEKEDFKNSKEIASGAKGVGKQFFEILRGLSKQIKIQDILAFQNKSTNPFGKEEDSKEYKDSMFIVFDTETTGLVQKSGVDKYDRFKERDVIYELAATAYDNDFKVVPDGTLHLKVNLKYVKYSKNPDKLLATIKRYNPDITDAQFTKLQEAHGIRADIDGFKFNNAEYKKAVQEILPGNKNVDKIVYTLKEAFQIKRLMKMTHAEKETFKRIEGGWDKENSIGPDAIGTVYDVDRKSSESQLLNEFVAFVTKIKKQYSDKKVYVVAQNLPYDQGIVSGGLRDINRQALADIIKFKLKGESKKSISAIKNELKKIGGVENTRRKGNIKIGKLFDITLDTKDVFTQLIKGEKKRQKILLEVYTRISEQSGVRMKKLESILDNPKSSVSLGFLGRISDNPAWHTATNDVYVTIQATKNWLATIRLTHILLAIKEGADSIKVRGMNVDSKTYPEFFAFIKKYGLTGAEYNSLKKSLGIPVATFNKVMTKKTKETKESK